MNKEWNGKLEHQNKSVEIHLGSNPRMHFKFMKFKNNLTDRE